MHLGDTIVAIATPPGRGGIGIVRLSGPQSVSIATALVRLPQPPRSWTPARGQLIEDDGEILDDVLLTWFAAPRSYTSEDVVEIACHGAPVVLRRCIERALQVGARLAEPGEFTFRAFLLGRIDLPQAEAVRDLIDATTLHQARVAAQQTDGALSRQIQPLKKELIDLIALLEAGIDFAEDDISVAPNSELLRRLNPLASAVDRLARSFNYGQVLREGFSLAIVGQPNVGKSSLFNRLLESDRAIVTDIPGTTRDLVSESTAIDGIPVRLVDTAGIRDGQEPIETLGIERSYTAIADADLCLFVVDARQSELDSRDRELLERVRASGRFLLVANKADLTTRHPPEALAVSALTGQGIAALRRGIVDAVAPDADDHQSNAVITNLRQAHALREASAALAQALTAITDHIPHEMLLLDLYSALGALDALTGKTTADDILHRIFATFCIGK